MKNHHYPAPRANRAIHLSAAAGLAIFLSAGAARAAVTVNSSVNLLAGVYTYSYTVTNFGTTFDLAVVDIAIAPGASISNLVAPTGFGIVYDADPTNLLSFFEDADLGTSETFAPNSTSSTFSYQSTDAPILVNFSALDANGDIYSGTTLAAVPEPSSLLLFSAAALPLLTARRRRTNG